MHNSALYSHTLSTGIGWLIQRYLERPFSSRDRVRVSLYFNPYNISFSQAYPFLYYNKQIRDRFRAELRLSSVKNILSGSITKNLQADIILIQPWFNEDPDELTRTLEELKKVNPEGRISFLDSYAHNDVRLTRYIEPFISYYLKKSLFRDRALYLRPWKGDTNLTEYYSNLYGIQAESVDWRTPEAIISRLRLTPNFFTDLRYIHKFTKADAVLGSNRPIDIHARLGGRRGTAWYRAMRSHALKQVCSLNGLRVISEGRVPAKEFLQELRLSKLCFSPFGYGELCWRDMEAILCGSVMVKPDMSHLETLPDLYEPGVTYLPVKWDFSDLEEVVRKALVNESLRQKIACEAYERVARYLREEQFLDDMEFLFLDTVSAPG